MKTTYYVDEETGTLYTKSDIKEICFKAIGKERNIIKIKVIATQLKLF